MIIGVGGRGNQSSGGSCKSGQWIRNEDWEEMPEVTPANERFYGLYLVFEGEYNQAHAEVNFTTSATYDWDDGTTGSFTSGVKETHVYDYATMSGDIYQNEHGKNYKQAMVAFEGVDITSFEMDFAPATINKGGTQNFADILCSWPNATTVNFANSNWTYLKLSVLERLRVLAWKSPLATWGNQLYASCMKLAVLELPFDQIVTAGSFLRGSGTHFMDMGDISWDALTSANQLFNLAGIGKIGNQTFPIATTLAKLHYDNFNLVSTGTITASIATSLHSAFINNVRLEYVGDIDVPNLGTIHSMFSGCTMNKRCVILDASNITSTTNAFGSTGQAKSYTEVLLHGITVGFNLLNANMQDTEIDAMFTALGTASGAQTITVTGNPGAATCDTSIATTKGFTVAT